MTCPESELRTRIDNQADLIGSLRLEIAMLKQPREVDRALGVLVKRVHHWRVAAVSPAPLHAEALLALEEYERKTIASIKDAALRNAVASMLDYRLDYIQPPGPDGE